MKDKHKIELTLKVLQQGGIDNKEAVDSMLEFYSQSKRFNYHNFIWGLIAGKIIVCILTYFKFINFCN